MGLCKYYFFTFFISHPPPLLPSYYAYAFPSFFIIFFNPLTLNLLYCMSTSKYSKYIVYPYFTWLFTLTSFYFIPFLGGFFYSFFFFFMPCYAMPCHASN